MYTFADPFPKTVAKSASVTLRGRRILPAWVGLWLIFSLTFAFAACQTPNPQEPKEKERAFLDSQLLVVRSHLSDGKPDAALVALRTLARDYPNSAPVENMLGLTHLALRNPARAIRHFTKAHKLDREPATALNLSSALIEAGDFQKAVDLLTEVTKSEAGRSYERKERLFHNLGYAHARMGQNGHAADWLRVAIEENPTFFPSYLELARIYEKTKRPALAMKTYQQATDHCLSCFEPVYALSRLYIQAQKPADARRLLLRFMRQDNLSSNDRQEALRLLRVVTAAGSPRTVPQSPKQG